MSFFDFKQMERVLFDLITHFVYSIHFISFHLAPYWQDYSYVQKKVYTKKSVNLIQYSMSTSGETSAESLSIKQRCIKNDQEIIDLTWL